MRVLLGTAMACVLCSSGWGQNVSPLFARGYTVLPQPQKVLLEAADFRFDPASRIKLEGEVRDGDIAVTTLRDDFASRFHAQLGSAGQASGTLTLRMASGSVPIGPALAQNKEALKAEAYRLDLHQGNVVITANAPTGLFYGVATFLQLLKSQAGALWLPAGQLEDWPDLEVRHIYWDDNHHLEKVDELKRVLRQAAFYKINGVVLKLDGHFQYKSAPAVVEPYALTPAELQELTDYGLKYHVQLIPFLDGPAHISFILKHPEYAALREYPESNYELCATNPASYELLKGMYRDLLEANKGVSYFYLSTDEPYYLGLAKNSQCNEQDLARQLGTAGQVFAQFVDKTGGYLRDKGRSVIFWGEYPLKPSDVAALPPYLINGEVYGPAFDKAFRERGIRQMIFTSVEGEEKMFPDYSILPPGARLHGKSTDEFEDNPQTPRVEDVMRTISYDSSRSNASLMGEVNAGWADEGVHPETFWLGYVASGAVAWHPGSPARPELESSFYSLFYGPQTVAMESVYRLMSEQAQAWTDSWDAMASKARKPIWGSSYEIFKTPQPAHDQTLPLPPAPDGKLDYGSSWSHDNEKRIRLAEEARHTNDQLLALLYENLSKSQFNRYNLEIFVSIADLCRHGFQMIEDIHHMDESLSEASRVKQTNPAEALKQVDAALDSATSIWQGRNDALEKATSTWYQRWTPRVAEANGRRHLDEVDDVKDHLPDRTVDMTYLVYREKMLPFGEWVHAIAAARNQFAASHHLPVRDYRLRWEDFAVNPPSTIMQLSSTAPTAATQ